MRYVLVAVALLKACDVTNNGLYLGRHFGFCRELEIRKALDNIDLNQMSHRYVSGDLQND